MKRPAFQFYAGDWLRNVKLRRCTPAARGVWMDVLCLLHDSEEYGVVRWPLKELASASGAALKHLRELADKGVLKGADKDAEPYVYRPKHAGQQGEPVTLLEANGGPIWYSSRMVRDDEVRRRRGGDTRFEAGKNPGEPKPKTPPDTTPNPPIGGQSGDGSSSASAFASADGTAPAGTDQQQQTDYETLNHTQFALLVAEHYAAVWNKPTPPVNIPVAMRISQLVESYALARSGAWWRLYFSACHDDEFLNGTKKPGFRADFMYLLRPEVFTRVIDQNSGGEHDDAA